MSITDGHPRAIAELVCTAKEFEAWKLIEDHHMTFRQAANHIGVSAQCIHDRHRNALTKIARYSRAQFVDPPHAEPHPPKETNENVAIALLIERDGSLCYLCRRETIRGRRHIEHIIPTIHGGADEPSNLALACFECNARKSAKFVSLLVSSGRPVYHAR